MYYIVVQMIDIVCLSWDDCNTEHIRRHGVTQEDVEHACHSEPVLFKQSYKDRLVILGPDENDRVLAVVIGQVPFEPAGVFFSSLQRDPLIVPNAVFTISRKGAT
jgi:uncharacterized DUF497 family protein